MDYLKDRYNFKRWEKRVLAYALDLLGYGATAVWRSLFPPKEPDQIRRILAVRLDHLGDIVMTRPALAALKARYPDAELDVLVSEEYRPLLEGQKDFHQVLGYRMHWFARARDWQRAISEYFAVLDRLRKRKYDLGVDFRGDARNILLMTLASIAKRLGYGRTGGGFLLTRETVYPASDHQVEVNLALLESLGVSAAHALRPFQYSEARRQDFWDRFRDTLGAKNGPRIVIHPGAGYPSKQWGSLKYWELVRRILQEQLGQVVLIGTESEKGDLPDIDASEGALIDLRGKTELADLPVLFDHSDFFIGNDSGPAHLAAAQGLEVLSIFSGTNDSRLWRPWTNRLHLVDHPVACSPCEARVCPLGHHDCMEKIPAERVYQTLEEMIRQQKGAVQESL